MSVKIVIDSTTDIKNDLIGKFTVVPMPLAFGDQQYLDGLTITKQEFYEKLGGDVLPTTSQATPADWDDKFKPIVDNGDTVLCITLSSTLSGSYQSATIAATEYPDKVFVVNGYNVAIGSGVLVEYALKLVEQGFDAETIAEHIEKVKDKVKIVAVVDTLEYLKKGGRISKTVAFAGGLLNIKPVIGVIDGEVKMLNKARGLKQANKLLLEESAKLGEIDFDKPVLFGYTGTSDSAVLDFINETKEHWNGNTEYAQIGSSIGTHVGPGAVAVAFFVK